MNKFQEEPKRKAGRIYGIKQKKLKYKVMLYDINEKEFNNIGSFTTFENISDELKKTYDIEILPYNIKYLYNKNNSIVMSFIVILPIE